MNIKYKYLYIVSLLLLLSGAALQLTGHFVFDLGYALGAAGYLAYYLVAPERDAPRVVRRVARMGVFSGLLFGLSAVARFGVFDAYGQNAWLLFLALGLVYMIYGNVLLYLDEKKHGKKN